MSAADIEQAVAVMIAAEVARQMRGVSQHVRHLGDLVDQVSLTLEVIREALPDGTDAADDEDPEAGDTAGDDDAGAPEADADASPRKANGDQADAAQRRVTMALKTPGKLLDDFKVDAAKAVREAAREVSRKDKGDAAPAKIIPSHARPADMHLDVTGKPGWWRNAVAINRAAKNRVVLDMLVEEGKATLSGVIYAFRPPLKETYALNVISEVRRLLKQGGHDLVRGADGTYTVEAIGKGGA